MYSSKISLKSEKMKNNINFTMSPEPRFLQLRNRKCFFHSLVNTLFLQEQRTNSNQLINIIHFRLFHVLYTPCLTLIRVATITVNVSFLATYHLLL